MPILPTCLLLRYPAPGLDSNPLLSALEPIPETVTKGGVPSPKGGPPPGGRHAPQILWPHGKWGPYWPTFLSKMWMPQHPPNGPGGPQRKVRFSIAIVQAPKPLPLARPLLAIGVRPSPWLEIPVGQGSRRRHWTGDPLEGRFETFHIRSVPGHPSGGIVGAVVLKNGSDLLDFDLGRALQPPSEAGRNHAPKPSLLGRLFGDQPQATIGSIEAIKDPG